MEKSKPIITREETEDGWIIRADYGKDGVSVGTVHVLSRYGYQLADTAAT